MSYLQIPRFGLRAIEPETKRIQTQQENPKPIVAAKQGAEEPLSGSKFFLRDESGAAALDDSHLAEHAGGRNRIVVLGQSIAACNHRVDILPNDAMDDEPAISGIE
jgi:hypothetical protein